MAKYPSDNEVCRMALSQIRARILDIVGLNQAAFDLCTDIRRCKASVSYPVTEWLSALNKHNNALAWLHAAIRDAEAKETLKGG